MVPEEIEGATFPTARRGYDPEAVHHFLAAVANELRAAVRFPPPPAVPPPPPPLPPRAFADQLGEEVASIVDFATQAAEELQSKAELEADAIRSAAAEEAAETTRAAMRQLEVANQTRAEAERDAEAIRAAGRYEASRIEQEARATAASVERAALDKVRQLERAANDNVAAVLGEAHKRYEQLRSAQRQSLERLTSLEALICRAREQASDEEFPPDAQELLSGPQNSSSEPEPNSSSTTAKAGRSTGIKRGSSVT